jgi:hypothetical protein
MANHLVGSRTVPGLLAVLALAAAAACQPTVKVEAPDKPIVINMNVKIDQEVRVKLDKDVQQMLNERSDVF